MLYDIACIRKIEPVVQVNNTKYPIANRLYYMSSRWLRLLLVITKPITFSHIGSLWI